MHFLDGDLAEVGELRIAGIGGIIGIPTGGVALLR